jgi:hypothetical protein
LERGGSYDGQSRFEPLALQDGTQCCSRCHA